MSSYHGQCHYSSLQSGLNCEAVRDCSSQFGHFGEGSRASTQSFLGMECMYTLERYILILTLLRLAFALCFSKKFSGFK